MKKLKLILGLLFFMAASSQAQVSVNVNLGTPPVWAPADRVESQYYYLPDVDAYYDVPASKFIYVRNGSWIRSTSLPYRYRNYNLRGGNVVYLKDYRGNSPYAFHKNHKIKYAKKVKYANPRYKKYRGEKYENKGNGRKQMERGEGNGNGNGNGKGNGKKDK